MSKRKRQVAGFVLARPSFNRLRIIDGLIAEHLFGWQWWTIRNEAFLIPPRSMEIVERHPTFWERGIRDKRVLKRYDIELCYPDDYQYWGLPRYTIDRAANWNVIEGYAERFTSVNILDCKNNKPRWRVGSVGGQSLQIAVCLAALDKLEIKLPW